MQRKGGGADRTRCGVSYICNHDNNNSVNKNAVVLHMNNITTNITRQIFFSGKQHGINREACHLCIMQSKIWTLSVARCTVQGM